VNHAIRGGGIIFIIAILIWFYTSNFLWPWFVLGACAIAVISFLDDVISLNQLVRFLVQLISVLLLFLQVWPISWPIYLLLIALIVCIGALNAFNFMDGINGITGVYALVALFTFGFIQQQIVSFTDIFLLGVVVLSVLIFLFFNFRQQARCFAGDIGSITIAFILIFFLLQLIHVTGNFLWPLLFLVYGTDSIITIIYRLKRKENIFKAHRTHLFQYLSNELKWSHRSVSVLYGSVQLVINCVLVNTLAQQQYLLPLVLSGLFFVAYIVARKIVLSKISSANG
jgi:UDP-N-acetylmuramyl pentapeptide phosphotransferase/UDP-N-acetylglucosamine-1-phosphate transferase